LPLRLSEFQAHPQFFTTLIHSPGAIKKAATFLSEQYQPFKAIKKSSFYFLMVLIVSALG
jgi:hypothetical protein